MTLDREILGLRPLAVLFSWMLAFEAFDDRFSSTPVFVGPLLTGEGMRDPAGNSKGLLNIPPKWEGETTLPVSLRRAGLFVIKPKVGFSSCSSLSWFACSPVSALTTDDEERESALPEVEVRWAALAKELAVGANNLDESLDNCLVDDKDEPAVLVVDVLEALPEVCLEPILLTVPLFELRPPPTSLVPIDETALAEVRDFPVP